MFAAANCFRGCSTARGCASALGIVRRGRQCVAASPSSRPSLVGFSVGHKMQVRAMAKKRKGGGAGGGSGENKGGGGIAGGNESAASSTAGEGARLRLTERVTVETEIKKSRFVAKASPVSSPQEAMRFFDEVGDPSASHNCFAYKIGDQYRFSDDGEPGGTAGRPMLSAVEGSGFDGVAVLVTRYYGGVQLGAGGLVRAYGGAAAKVLEDADRVLEYPKVDAIITAPDFSHMGAVYQVMTSHGAEKEDEEFCDDGSVHVQVRVETREAAALGDALRDATQGKAEYRVLDD